MWNGSIQSFNIYTVQFPFKFKVETSLRQQSTFKNLISKLYSL